MAGKSSDLPYVQKVALGSISSVNVVRAGLWGRTMFQDRGSFKKVAVLTWLTVLVGGSQIAAASTISQTNSPSFNLNLSNPPTTTNKSLSFDRFNGALGTLTDVKIDLASSIFEDSSITFQASAGSSLSGLLNNGTFIHAGSGSGVTYNSTTHPTLTGYTGAGSLLIGLVYSMFACGEGRTCGIGEGWTGIVTVTYTYDPVSSVPLPAALPMFATGVAGLGFMGWLRRLKQKAKKHA
jgi:hypothetical protein